MCRNANAASEIVTRYHIAPRDDVVDDVVEVIHDMETLIDAVKVYTDPDNADEMLESFLDQAEGRLDPEAFVQFINEKTSDDGQTALIFAAFSNNFIAIEEILSFAQTRLTRGQFAQIINTRSNEDETALLSASERNNTAAIRALLKAAEENLTRQQFGRFINARNKYGKTALILAAENNNTEILLPIITAAETNLSNSGFLYFINEKTADNKTALDLFIEYNNERAINAIVDAAKSRLDQKKLAAFDPAEKYLN